MAFIDDVKTALRISHTKLDDEITATIATAKAEMVRAGMNDGSISETDSLVSMAIKTYCKYEFSSDPKQRDGFFASWQYQLDCLRKSTGYDNV